MVAVVVPVALAVLASEVVEVLAVVVRVAVASEAQEDSNNTIKACEMQAFMTLKKIVVNK